MWGIKKLKKPYLKLNILMKKTLLFVSILFLYIAKSLAQQQEVISTTTTATITNGEDRICP